MDDKDLYPTQERTGKDALKPLAPETLPLSRSWQCAHAVAATFVATA